MDAPPPAGWMHLALRRLPRGATVFCFHGIRGGREPDGGGIHVGADQLSETLELAADLGTVVPLRDLVARLERGRPIDRLVALTFDDACRSIATRAAPLLERAGLHATIFAVREASESGRPYWWDRLSQAGPHLSADEQARLLTALDAGAAPRTAADVTRLARDLVVVRHRGAMPAAASDILLEAETRLALTGHYDCAMTGDEIAALVAGGHFDVGVHTVSHRTLPLLTDEEVLAEITDCHRWLRGVSGATLPYLAIPFGLLENRTVRLARSAGMEAVMRIAPRNVGPRAMEEGVPRFSASEKRRGWKLRAALLGAYEWAYRTGLRSGPADPPMPGLAS